MFVDPLPAGSPQRPLWLLSPTVQQMRARRLPPGVPRPGDIQGLLAGLDVLWPSKRIVWDRYNALPRDRDRAREVVFVSREAGSAFPFNPNDPVTRSLQRLMLMFPGSLKQPEPEEREFALIPLLTTSANSGTLAWDEVVAPTDRPHLQLRPGRAYLASPEEYTLAGRVVGQVPVDRLPEDRPRGAPQPELNLIVVADLDIISDGMFQFRQARDRELDFDNVTFVLNCVDSLAGDESLIPVRSRRPVYRTLGRIEAEQAQFDARMDKAVDLARRAEKREMDEAVERMEAKLEQIKQREDLGEEQRRTRLEQARELERRRLEVAWAETQAETREQIRAARLHRDHAVAAIRRRVRLAAVLLPPVPPMLLGLIVLILQVLRERRGTPLARSMRRER
jgi:ABC-2 type transport system permease protein